MTKETQTPLFLNQHVGHLFEIGPRLQSLQFGTSEIKAHLTQFANLLKASVGKDISLIAFPQRIFTQSSWKLHLRGDKGERFLLVNIAGRIELPPLDIARWNVRLNIDTADHIDAYWLIEFLCWALQATRLIPTDLSPVFGDKTVDSSQNEGEESNE